MAGGSGTLTGPAPPPSLDLRQSEARRLTGTWLPDDPGDVESQRARGAMSELIVPPTLAALLSAFTSCFQARSYLTLQWLVLG